VLLVDVLTACNDVAFAVSDLPLILSIENHCTVRVFTMDSAVLGFAALVATAVRCAVSPWILLC
jgi:hypothetical protein